VAGFTMLTAVWRLVTLPAASLAVAVIV